MAFLVEPPGGHFQYVEGTRGPRGLPGEPGPEGPPGEPADPEHTHVIDDTTGLQDTLNAKADLVDGQLTTSQLPALSITDTFTVASQAAMLALAAQRGDVAIRSDTSQTFILADEPATTLSNWKELPTPGDAVISVNGQSGVVVLSAGDLAALAASLIDAKGDLLPGTANDTAGRLAVGADRKVLTARSGETTGLGWEYPTVPATTVGANHALALTDSVGLLIVSAAGDLTVTVPTNATTPFPVGTVVNIGRGGAGNVTITAAGGVTLRSVENKVQVDKQYQVVSVHKIGADEWWLYGALK